VDWEDYHSRFAGSKLTEEQFTAMAYQACSRVKRLCRPYVLKTVLENEDDYRNDRLKDAVCCVINEMYEQCKNGAGSGVTSVSNDGYSESYAVTKKTDADLELDTLAKAQLYGTGLMGAL
jgi:hypothetical protein